MHAGVFLLRCSKTVVIIVCTLATDGVLGQQLRVSSSDCAALLSVQADLPGTSDSQGAVMVPLSIELGRHLGVPRGVVVELPLGAIITGRQPAPPPEVMAAIRRACSVRHDTLRGAGTSDVLSGR